MAVKLRSLLSLLRNPGLAVCLLMALTFPDTGLSVPGLAADMTARPGPFDAASPDALDPAHAALLRFAREAGGIAALPAVGERFSGLAPSEEASLADLFRDPSERGLRLPGRAPDCGPNRNCIADGPPALLLSRIRVDGRDVPVRVGALAGGHLGAQNALHEPGHGLGPGHPHDSGGNSQDVAARAAASAGEIASDNQRYTVMSYEKPGWNQNTAGTFGFAVTPMALDIAALLNIYDATEAYTRDTTYTLTTPDRPRSTSTARAAASASGAPSTGYGIPAGPTRSRTAAPTAR